MDPCQRRNLMVRTCPKLVLKRLWTSLVRGKMMEEEILRKRYRGRQAIRIEGRGIERRFKGYKEERKWTEEKGK